MKALYYYKLSPLSTLPKQLKVPKMERGRNFSISTRARKGEKSFFCLILHLPPDAIVHIREISFYIHCLNEKKREEKHFFYFFSILSLAYKQTVYVCVCFFSHLRKEGGMFVLVFLASNDNKKPSLSIQREREKTLIVEVCMCNNNKNL